MTQTSPPTPAADEATALVALANIEAVLENMAQGIERMLALLERYQPLLDKAEQRLAKPSLFGRRPGDG